MIISHAAKLKKENHDTRGYCTVIEYTINADRTDKSGNIYSVFYVLNATYEYMSWEGHAEGGMYTEYRGAINEYESYVSAGSFSCFFTEPYDVVVYFNKSTINKDVAITVIVMSSILLICMIGILCLYENDKNNECGKLCFDA